MAMEIKDIQGNVIVDVPITQSAVKTEELMKQYSIALSWNAISDDELPLGSYIEYEGVRYSLLEPYSPEQRDEATFEYRPVFQHPIMRLSKALFFFYTYSDGVIVSKELDWSLTDNPANFMSAICDALLNELGESWTYEIASDLPASTSLSFSNTDIFSALNSIAGAFETEWWFDYTNKVLYLSKAQHGEAVTLEVGQNIGVPQVTPSKEGYYTRFYVFGSTRNIDQSYAGANVNSIVNRRLTLDPTKYPNGYIDIREGLTQEEILPTALVFDNIYPRSYLTISDVKVRLMWRLDDNSQKIPIGTDSEGNEVYDQYAIWYFKIPELTFSKDMLISGKSLSVHFNSGTLNGREFELTYHDTAKQVETSDGTTIKVEAGDYEINFIEEGSYIIPAITGLIPADGDSVTLFNIVMPEEYKSGAYEELETEALKAIAKRTEDNSNYTFDSNKVAFYESNPNLTIGSAVIYKNGEKSLSTRVIKLETQLDYPFEQRITIGNAQIKGTQQTLKEEVVNANQNIDLINAINENTEAFQQSLQRTQKAVLESIARWGDAWYFDEQGNLHTNYTIVAEGDVVSGGSPDGEGGEDGAGSGSGSTVVVTPVLTEGEHIATIQVDGVPQKIYAPKTTEVDLSGYATEDYVDSAIQNAKDTRVDTLINTTIPALESDIAKRALQSSLDSTNSNVSNLQSAHSTLRSEFDALSAVLNDDVSGKINTWNEVVDFLDEYSGSQDLATILSAMNADIAKRALQTSLDTTNANLTALTTRVTTAENSITSVSNKVKTFEDIIGIDSSGDVYIKKKSDGTARNFYTYGDVISGGEGDGSSSGSGSGGSTVSWANSYTSANGLKIATISIDGVDTPVYTAKNLSAYTNDSGYITSAALSGYATQDWVTAKGYLTSVSWSAVTGKPTFATVATSGKYSDLSGTPTIPTSLKSPYALTFGSKTYNGSAAKTILASDLGALTAHQTLYALTINNSAGTAQVTYTPNSKAASITLTKAMVGLGNVENTALSTWAGSSKITTLGTITSGVWNGTKIANAYLANSSITISGTAVSLGGSITQAALRTALGLGSNAYTSTAYLPLSGGTIIGDYGALSIKRNNAYASLIKFENTGGNLGYLGFNSANIPVAYTSDAATMYTLIHSGNIGSYSLIEDILHSGDSLPPRNRYGLWQGVGAYIRVGASDGYSLTLYNQGGALKAALTQGSADATWKTIAFTDSNVASATKLQTARTIWGQSFDGSANVTGNLHLSTSALYWLSDSDNYSIQVKGDGHAYYKAYYGHRFYTAGVERLYITSGGLIAHPSGSTNNRWQLSHSSNTFYLQSGLTDGSGVSGNVTISGINVNDLGTFSVKATTSTFSGNVKVGSVDSSTVKIVAIDSAAAIQPLLSLVNTKQGTAGSYGVAIRMGYSATQYYSKIATVFENISPGYLNPSLRFYTMNDTYQENTEVERMRICSNGNVSIGHAGDGGVKLYVAGNFVATGEVTSGSDARYKSILSHADIDLETIANAPIINFKWTDREDDKVHLGSTAQYWYGTAFKHGVIPTNDEKLWTMGYGQIALASVVSVAKKVVNHEERIAALERENQQLKNELKQYRRA